MAGNSDKWCCFTPFFSSEFINFTLSGQFSIKSFTWMFRPFWGPNIPYTKLTYLFLGGDYCTRRGFGSRSKVLILAMNFLQQNQSWQPGQGASENWWVLSTGDAVGFWRKRKHIGNGNDSNFFNKKNTMKERNWSEKRVSFFINTPSNKKCGDETPPFVTWNHGILVG